MDYINIDLVSTEDNFKLVKTTNANEIFKAGDEVYSSQDGVVVVKEITAERVKPKYVKVYQEYNIKAGETLKTVVNRFFTDFPATKMYYTPTQLCNVIIRDNNLRSNQKQALNRLKIPAYIPLEKEELPKLEELSEYEFYFVGLNDRAYYQIVMNLGYTNDQDEIIRLANIIKELNGNDKPQVFSEITVPNVQRYKLEQMLKEKEEKLR